MTGQVNGILEEVRRFSERPRRPAGDRRREACERGQEDPPRPYRSGSWQGGVSRPGACKGSWQSGGKAHPGHLAPSETGPSTPEGPLVGRGEADGVESRLALQREESDLERRPYHYQASKENTR